MATAFAFLGASCAGPSHKALDPAVIAETANVDVYSTIAQEEPSIHFDESHYAQANTGGLLFVLLEKQSNKSTSAKLEERIAPLLEAAADVDFRTQFWSALESAFVEPAWLHAQALQKRFAAPPNGSKEPISLPALQVDTSYELSRDARVLTIQTAAAIYLTDRDEADYRGWIVYFSEPIGPRELVDDAAIAEWARDGARRYREAMALGVSESMKMLRKDLRLDGSQAGDTAMSDVSMRLVDPRIQRMRTFKGRALEESNGRVLMRRNDGDLYSIPRAIEQ